MADIMNVVHSIISRRRCRSESEHSSGDDSGDEESIRRKRVLRPRIENYAQDVVTKYLDEEFRRHFRMSRATFDFLLEIVGPKITRKVSGCPTIPSREQLMIALWKMATMDSYRSVSDRFNVGQAGVFRAVRRVAKALEGVAPQFIQWPTEENAVLIMRGFEEASGFPKTIGAIDGTHIKIAAPQKHAADYVNRKGFHSIHLQVVCDHKALITHCHCGDPGSVHDQRVLRKSEVAQFLNDEHKFPAGSHLIGDAAYELHNHLLVPFRDNGHLSLRQKNFNFQQSSARMAVERCFGLLKGRMRSLLNCLPMTKVNLISEYIVACCVLHNVCTLRREEMTVLTIPAPQGENDNERDMGMQIRGLGVHKRNMVMDSLVVR